MATPAPVGADPPMWSRGVTGVLKKFSTPNRETAECFSMDALPTPEPTDAAYGRIREWIVEGRFAPGERLIEQRVADDLGLSRTPVREAFRLLSAEGLVVAERNRGVVVRNHSREEITDVYELRARLEALVAERAAERADAQGLDRLSAAARRFRRATQDRSTNGIEHVRSLSDANREFHEALIDLASFGLLGQALRVSVDIPLVFRAFQEFNRAKLERSDVFHHLIVEAVAAGEPARAGRLMMEHILQGRDALLGLEPGADPPLPRA